MTVDRGSAQLTAERTIHAHETMPTERGVPLAWVSPDALELSRAYLALLAELKQAESLVAQIRNRAERADRRLAKVPALVEALREVAEMAPPVIAVVNGALNNRIRDALAVWDAEA